MKKKMSKVLALLAVVAMLCGVLPAGFVLPASAAVSADNLIVNGDFETGNMTGWDVWDVAAKTNYAKNGSYGAGWDGGGWRYNKQTIQVEQNTKYQVSFWYKGSLALYIKGDGSSTIWDDVNGVLVSKSYTNVSEYTYCSFIINSGSYTSILFEFQNYNSGAYYVDDVQVIKAPLIGNGNFEEGDNGKWWNTGWGTDDVVTTQKYEGNYSAYVAGWGAFRQSFTTAVGYDYVISYYYTGNVMVKDAQSGLSKSQSTTIGTWKQGSLTITADEVTNNKIEIELSGNGGSGGYVDNVVVTAVKVEVPKDPSFDGFITNGDFETGTTTGGWSTGKASISNEQAKDNYSLKMTGASQYDGTTLKVNVERNKNYVLTYDIYSVNAANWTPQLFIKDMSNGDMVLGDYIYPPSVPAGKWTTYTVEFNSGENTYVTFQFCIGVANNTKYLDNVTMKEIKEPSNDGYIINGDFETGDKTGWPENWGGTAVFNKENAMEGNFGVGVSGGGWDSIKSGAIAVKINTDYKLTFWYKGAGVIFVKKADGSTNIKDEYPSNSASWKKYEITFNSGDQTNIRIELGCAGNASISIDNVLMWEVKDPSFDGYITNGDFETGDNAGWTLSGTSAINAAAAYGGSGYGLYVKGDQWWSGYGKTNVFEVKAGVEYALNFDAKIFSSVYVFFKKCDADGKNVTDIIQGGRYYNSNAAWTAFSETFTVPAGVEYMYLEFSGAGNGEAYFDNVSLEKMGGNDPVPNPVLIGGQTSVSDGAVVDKSLAFRFEVKASGAQVDGTYEYRTGSATVTPFLDVEGDYRLVRAGAVVTNSTDIGKNASAFTLDSVDNNRVLNIEAVNLCEVNEDSFAYAVRIIRIPDRGLDTNIYARPYYVYEAEGAEVTVYGSVVFNNYNYAADSDMTLTGNAISLGIRTDMLDKALVSKGNQARLAKVMNRARNGEDITVGFIGGSVTEGAYASDYTTKSYAGLTKAWWDKTFPQSDVTFVNAGIGGTSSLFGVHRVEEDLLSKEPDFVVIEYGVNDVINETQAEAYASLVRRVLSHESQPAVLLLFVMNDDGSNAQSDQQPIGAYYDLPMISYRDAVWPEVKTQQNPTGQYDWSDIAADWVHPTDKGHAIIAELVCAYLQKTYENLSAISTEVPALPIPERPYSFENAVWYNSTNTTPKSMGSFSVYTSNGCSWKSNGNQPIVIEFTGKRVFIPLTADNAENPNVTIRIDGGAPFSMETILFKGGRYANYLVFDEDTAGKHTIEITCNSGTLYLGGLFVS